MNACERPARSGPDKGEVRTGTAAGYHVHRRAGEAPCEACAVAHSEYCRQYRAANLETRREYDRQYHAENREARLEHNRRWRAENSEAYREYLRRWRAENPEWVRRYREENAHIIRERYWANRTPTPDEDEPRWTVYRALYLSPDFDADPWHGAVYYVGQTSRDPEERWTEHVQSKRWLDNTLWQVVEAGLTRRQAFDLENRLVDEHYSTLTNDAAVQRRDAEDIPHPPYRAFPATAFTNR